MNRPFTIALQILLLTSSLPSLRAEKTPASANTTFISFGPKVPDNTRWHVDYVDGGPFSTKDLNVVVAYEDYLNIHLKKELAQPKDSATFIAHKGKLGMDHLSFRPNLPEDGCIYTIRFVDDAERWVEFRVQKPIDDGPSSREVEWTMVNADGGAANMKLAEPCFTFVHGKVTLNQAELPWLPPSRPRSTAVH